MSLTFLGVPPAPLHEGTLTRPVNKSKTKTAMPAGLQTRVGATYRSEIELLAERFPDARFILLEREEEVWFDSMCRNSGGRNPGWTDVHARIYQHDEEWNELAHFLLANDVYTTLRYHPLHLNPVYLQTHRRLPNCERLNQEAISIPLHPRLAAAEVGKVCDLIRQFHGRR